MSRREIQGEPHQPEKKTEAMLSERIIVRADGRRVCWNCGATLAKADEDRVLVVNGYQLRATAIRDGVENPIGVYVAGRKAKAAFRADLLKAKKGDVRAQNRLRTGESTAHIRMQVLRIPSRELDPAIVEQKREAIRRNAQSMSEPVRSTLLAMANGSAKEVAAVIDSWNWVDPTEWPKDLGRSPGRHGFVKEHHVLIECLGCGKYNESAESSVVE